MSLGSEGKIERIAGRLKVNSSLRTPVGAATREGSVGGRIAIGSEWAKRSRSALMASRVCSRDVGDWDRLAETV